MYQLTVFLLFTMAPAWVYWDATANRIGKLPGKSSAVGFSARGWALGTLVVMFVFLPLYLFRRPMLIARAQQHPADPQWRIPKATVFATIGAVIFGLNVATASQVSNADQSGARSLAAALPTQQGRIGELALICDSPEALSQSLSKFHASEFVPRNVAIDEEHCASVPAQHYVDVFIDTGVVDVLQSSKSGDYALKMVRFTTGHDKAQRWAFANSVTFDSAAR